MQTHVVQLTKQRLSDFFVKEDGHVAHKNALVAGTVATGAIFASLMLEPDTAEAHHGDEDNEYMCGENNNHTHCVKGKEDCRSHVDNGVVSYFCVPI
ncbi:hypothetical protein J4G07_18230 [Candidatus Poribacteria bacterium]|nr:hypothetical protein [Candidatus Poribacteria bacterium]